MFEGLAPACLRPRADNEKLFYIRMLMIILVQLKRAGMAFKHKESATFHMKAQNCSLQQRGTKANIAIGDTCVSELCFKRHIL